jgi:cytoplasmic iron level regulating protein YaaA (DUF328/UPF0246 family)
MKKINHFLFTGLVFLTLSFIQPSPKSILDNRLNNLKNECKELIKPARYEGSRITYYTVKKKTQKKNIELFLLLESEYFFSVSTKECSTNINIRFFDSQDVSKRTLIWEEKSAKGKTLVISSKDLNTAYVKKVAGADRLKNIFIEYEIAPGKENLEAIVMVVGNK